MELMIGRDEFLKGLSRAQGFVSPRGPMPILANILMETSESGVTLFASNLDIGFRGSCAAQVKKPGKITVQAKKLHDIVKELPSEDILVKSDEDDRLRIICGKSKFNLATIDPEEYPAFPVFEESGVIGLDSQMVKEMISKTSYSISQDETRMTLHGAYLEIAPSRARMVATDGHRLAFVEREGAFNVKETVKAIIARKAIAELTKLLGEGDDPLMFAQQDNHVMFRKGLQSMVVRLIEGAFPNYEQVIPKANSREAVISSDAFLKSLKRVAILADEKSHMVRLIFTKGKLELASEGGELGEGRDEMEVEYAGDNLELGMNAHYIIDLLNAMGSEQVTLKMQDQLSPVLALSPSDKGLLAIIMPMRL
ncbi:MAG: DNA polymerase III subunit beta [Nitrospinae bacterium]|nr:DNA polymerase III subunit beta [Nitrospinota bacterium]MBF0634310.1 DNA polymerase III subunit beta [Nitrospinota bacterium]